LAYLLWKVNGLLDYSLEEETEMTFDFSNATPREILDQIAADGIVDAAEVETLRQRLEEDWHIGQDEAELLFRINDAVSQSEEHAESWGEFFSEAIARYLVFDMNTPGEVDAGEARWLLARLNQDQQVCDVERKLLGNIRKYAKTIHSELDELIQSLGIRTDDKPQD